MTRRSADVNGLSGSRRAAVCAAACALITVLIYLPALGNSFVPWDDEAYVFGNPHIKSLSMAFMRWALLGFHAANWHPLTWLSHAVDYAVWGLNPFGHHLTSVMLHGLNTFLVVMLAYRLTEARRREGAGLDEGGGLIAGVVTGLLFGIHPLHVESVAWVAERKDLLCGLFFILGILVYVGLPGEEEKWYRQKRYWLVVGLFALALLSKPMAVTFPVVLLILDWYPLGRMGQKGVLAEKIPLFALTLASGMITVFAQRPVGAITSLQIMPAAARTIVAVRSLAMYLRMMAVPENLAPYYHYPMHATFASAAFLVSVAVLTGIAMACLLRWRGRKLLCSVFLYYVITLLPVLGIMQVGWQAMADRYTYLPSLGPFMLAGVGAATAWEKLRAAEGRALRWAGAGIALLLLAALMSVTVRQTGVWKNGETLWSREIEVEPEGFMGYYCRGQYYLRTGRYVQAVDDLTRAVAVAPMNKTLGDALLSRALAYKALGRFDSATADLKEATELIPSSWEPYYYRGTIFSAVGKCAEAIADFDRAVAMSAGGATTEVYNDRGSCLMAAGRYEEALRDFTESIRLSASPQPKFYHRRGLVYEKMGLTAEANRDFEYAEALMSAPVHSGQRR